MAGHYKRSMATALQIGFGNCGAIVASNIFLTAEAPYYRTGLSISLGLLIFCGLSCTVFHLGLKRENKKGERGERDYRFTENANELDNLGDDHPSWRFSY